MMMENDYRLESITKVCTLTPQEMLKEVPKFAHLMTMMEKTFAETPKRTMAARTYPSPTRWNSSTVEYSSDIAAFAAAALEFSGTRSSSREESLLLRGEQS